MEQKLILFDIDKTLVKEMEHSSNPWPQAFESVYGIKCGITISQASSHGMTHKQIAIETLKNQGLKEGEIFKKMNLFIKILEKIYKKSLENGKITLFPKIPELLQKLSKKKYVLGLITGNTKEIALAKLKMAKIDKFFSIGGFGNDSANREELIKLALERAEEKYHFQFDEKKILPPHNLKICAIANSFINSLFKTSGWNKYPLKFLISNLSSNPPTEKLCK